MNQKWWYCGPPVHPTYLWILLEPELHLGERHVGAEDSFAAAAATARPKQFINYQPLRSITIDYLFGQSLSPPHSYIFYLFSWTFVNLDRNLYPMNGYSDIVSTCSGWCGQHCCPAAWRCPWRSCCSWSSSPTCCSTPPDCWGLPGPPSF